MKRLNTSNALLDDAYDFGRAAAANALSDIWAMGGKPVMANAVMGWPVDVLGVEAARKVMEGAWKGQKRTSPCIGDSDYLYRQRESVAVVY